MQLVQHYGGKYMTLPVRSKRLFTGSDTPPAVHYLFRVRLIGKLLYLLP
jgi:hypothetical protein